MNLSKRSPLLRNTQESFDRTVGNLGQELQQQELDDINGGSSLGCVLGGLGLYTATQSIATQIWRCGAVLTTSAECSRTGNSC